MILAHDKAVWKKPGKNNCKVQDSHKNIHAITPQIWQTVTKSLHRYMTQMVTKTCTPSFHRCDMTQTVTQTCMPSLHRYDMTQTVTKTLMLSLHRYGMTQTVTKTLMLSLHRYDTDCHKNTHAITPQIWHDTDCHKNTHAITPQIWHDTDKFRLEPPTLHHWHRWDWAVGCCHSPECMVVGQARMGQSHPQVRNFGLDPDPCQKKVSEALWQSDITHDKRVNGSSSWSILDCNHHAFWIVITAHSGLSSLHILDCHHHTFLTVIITHSGLTIMHSGLSSSHIM